MFKRIVVAVDGSDHAHNAVAVACDIAKHYDSQVTLVHSPQAETAAFAVGAVAGYHNIQTAPSHDELIAAGQKVVDAAMVVARDAGCDAGSEVIIGDAATRVVEVAQNKGADLIVCGRRGLGKVAGLVMGSTSNKIQHRAHCACLTVE